MHLLWLCNWLLSTLQCFEKWTLVMQYRIYSKPTKLNAPLKVITAFLSPPSCLFSEAQHVSHFARPNYNCMLPSRDMTAAIRLQKLWHDCHNSSVLWPRKKNPRTSIPWVELSKPEFDKWKRTGHQTEGSARQNGTPFSFTRVHWWVGF